MHKTSRSRKGSFEQPTNKRKSRIKSKKTQQSPTASKMSNSPGPASDCKKQSSIEQRFRSRRPSGKCQESFKPERDLRRRRWFTKRGGRWKRETRCRKKTGRRLSRGSGSLRFVSVVCIETSVGGDWLQG